MEGRQNIGHAAQDSRIAIAAEARDAKSAEAVGYRQGSALGTTVSRSAPIPYWTTPGSIVVDDFNGDGKDDLAVVNFCSDDPCGQSSVSVLLGKGDGTFQEHLDYLTGTGSVSIVVGDFNHDGRPDLAATNICLIPPVSLVPSASCWAKATAFPGAPG